MSGLAGRLGQLVATGKLATLDLSGGAFRVLLVLAHHADRKTGLVSMSQTAIAEGAGIARSNVEVAIKALVAVDLIEVVRPQKGRRPATYLVRTEKHLKPMSIGQPTRRAVFPSDAREWHGVDDLQAGQQDGRSRPDPSATKRPAALVADLLAGRQDAVADLLAGHLLRRTPRARVLNTVRRSREGDSHAGTCVASRTSSRCLLITHPARAAKRSATGPAGEAAQPEHAPGIRQQAVTSP